MTYDDAGKPIPVSERYNREKGDIRYALDEVDGTYFVRAEQNLFVKEDGTPYSEREIFDSLVGKTISLPDGDVKIVKRIPGKDMYNELFRRRPSKSGGVPDVGALSKNVNRNIEELISNSETTISNQADKGERHKQNGIKGFNTRRVKFYDGQRAYNVEFSIANMKNGEKIAYAKKFFGYDAALTKKIQTAEAASSQSRVNQQSESTDTMTQNGESVNRKYMEQTETRQFKRWFGNSKVVDKKGAPRKLYHYTDGEFTVFDTGKSGSNQGMRLGDGIYLSTSPTEFSSYGKNRMELYATISNPFEMQLTDEQANAVLDKYASTKHDLNAYDGVYRNHAFAKLTNPVRVMDYLQEYAKDNGIKVSDILKDLGYDGVHDGMEWVAFESGQVKSATDNIGTFDRNNPDIRYSLDTEQLEKTVRAIDTKALEKGLQSMNAVSNVNNFTMKDPSRFFDAISKGNESLRNELHDIFEKPHSEATGLYARNLEKMQERVKNIAKEAGVISQDGKKFDKAASAAVQNIGEGIAPIACSVEAKVVEADTISLKATRKDSEILSGDCTLEAQFFEIWKKLVERQSNIKPLTRERLLPEYRRIL